MRTLALLSLFALVTNTSVAYCADQLHRELATVDVTIAGLAPKNPGASIVLDVTAENRNRPRLSADGQTLYCASNFGRKRVGLARIRISPDGTPGPLEFIASRPSADVCGFAIDDQATRIAVNWRTAKGEDQVAIVDLIDETWMLVADVPAWAIKQISISHDGKTLAVVGDEHDIWTFSLDTKRWHEQSLPRKTAVYKSTLPGHSI